jgi:hypothetical protein
LQEWNPPQKRTLDPLMADEIKFMKLEHGKHKRDPLKAVYDPRPQHRQHTSENELQQFYEKLQSFGTPCVFLHVMSPASSLGTSPSTSQLREGAHAYEIHGTSIAQTQVNVLRERFVDHSSQEADAIERATRCQRNVDFVRQHQGASPDGLVWHAGKVSIFRKAELSQRCILEVTVFTRIM